jgi:carboxymethylenebutenolidase
VTATDKLAGIHAAVMGNFAGADKGITVEDVNTFTAAMKDAKKDIDVKIYEGKGHAFMNPGNAPGYDAAASDDAWKRIDAFFARTIGG